VTILILPWWIDVVIFAYAAGIIIGYVYYYQTRYVAAKRARPKAQLRTLLGKVSDEQKATFVEKQQKTMEIITETKKKIQAQVAQSSVSEDIAKKYLDTENKQEQEIMKEGTKILKEFGSYASAMPVSEEQRMQDIQDLLMAVEKLDELENEAPIENVDERFQNVGFGLWMDTVSREIRKITQDNAIRKHGILQLEKLNILLPRSFDIKDLRNALQLMKKSREIVDLVELNPKTVVIAFITGIAELSISEKVLLAAIASEDEMMRQKVQALFQWDDDFLNETIARLQALNVLQVKNDKLVSEGLLTAKDRATIKQKEADRATQAAKKTEFTTVQAPQEPRETPVLHSIPATPRGGKVPTMAAGANRVSAVPGVPPVPPVPGVPGAQKPGKTVSAPPVKTIGSVPVPKIAPLPAKPGARAPPVAKPSLPSNPVSPAAAAAPRLRSLLKVTPLPAVKPDKKPVAKKTVAKSVAKKAIKPAPAEEPEPEAELPAEEDTSVQSPYVQIGNATPINETQRQLDISDLMSAVSQLDHEAGFSTGRNDLGVYDKEGKPAETEDLFTTGNEGEGAAGAVPNEVEMLAEQILGIYEKQEIVNGGVMQLRKLQSLLAEEIGSYSQKKFNSTLDVVKSMGMIARIEDFPSGEKIVFFKDVELTDDEKRLIDLAIATPLQDFTQEFIGDSLGISPDDLPDLLKSLIDKGIIRLSGNSIQVPGVIQE
jgi:hypothetical protein